MESPENARRDGGATTGSERRFPPFPQTLEIAPAASENEALAQRFPHSHRPGDDGKFMKQSRKGAVHAARLKHTLQAHSWIGKDYSGPPKRSWNR